MTTICFLSGRNLGDAVMHAEFLRRLQRTSRAERWIIWTFPQARFLFEDLSDAEIICSDFPMGATGGIFVKGGWRSFLAAAWRIRAMKPDETVDLVGDLRERLILRFIGAPLVHSPEWETGHPFRNHIRTFPFKSRHRMTVPVRVLNLYEAHALMLTKIAPGSALDIEPPPHVPMTLGQALCVGLHPSASATFKLWPVEKWAELVALINTAFPGSRFTLFGAPNERTTLESFADSLDAPHELVTASLPEFKARVAHLDLLVGLDSFSVHLAHSQGVPSVVLVGANDPRVFTPPSGSSVTHPSRCSLQPCGGRPSCVGTSHQYSCMVDIQPQDVMNAILNLLNVRSI